MPKNSCHTKTSSSGNTSQHSQVLKSHQKSSNSTLKSKVENQTEGNFERNKAETKGHNEYAKNLNETHRSWLAQLNVSYENMLSTTPISHSKTLNISKCSTQIPKWHKHSHLVHLENPDFYNRLSLQSLFFIFYHYGGTKAQYYAACCLKKRDWRFHTQLNRWCQRNAEPHVQTCDLEQGPYVIFDFENWVQISEGNFEFEYRYLEDKYLGD